ncbi:nucleotidyltransferase family protein [Egbenema bharatensis]|uniref:nucleotidyltransferase family protein n=1 Tax=Egbenema bharatensis TaxID=3463334 RepID=UPI003A8566AF
MDSLEIIKTQLTRMKPAIQQQYHVTQLGIFGSYVRGEQTEDSDVDVLVEFDPTFRFGLFTFCELEKQLSEVLGKKVDLVMKDALKPHIGERILQEVVYL